MISSVQKFVGKRSISSALRKNREKKIFNFHTAKTLGITFKATQKWDMAILENFIRTAKKNNIEIHVIGWINEKELPSRLKENDTVSFLTKKDLNFWGLPLSEKFRNFISRKYDIFIDFSIQPNIITSFISARSHAKMKVARDMDETRKIFDFIIKTDEDIKQNTFFEHVTYYLNTINLPK